LTQVEAVESGIVVRLSLLDNGDVRLAIVDTRIVERELAVATVPSWRMDRLTRRRPVVEREGP
jgi:hypothetical protein